MPFMECGIPSLLIDELLSLCLEFLVHALTLLHIEGDLGFQLEYSSLVDGDGVDPCHQIRIVLEH